MLSEEANQNMAVGSKIIIKHIPLIWLQCTDSQTGRQSFVSLAYISKVAKGKGNFRKIDLSSTAHKEYLWLENIQINLLRPGTYTIHYGFVILFILSLFIDGSKSP